MELKIMSLNARRDLESDGVHAWPFRKLAVAKLICDENPIIVGLQEMLPHMMSELIHACPAYEMVGKERASGDEASPVMVRKDVVKIIRSRTFWLSPTPDIAQSKHPDAAYPRIATEVILRVFGKTLCVINTHLDHIGLQAKRDGIDIILNYRQSEDLPTIIMGDFNAPPEDPLHNRLSDAGMIRTNPTLKIATHHRFSGTYQGGPIDYIYHDHHFRCLHAGVIRSSTQHYISDHDPVWAVLSTDK